MTPSREWYEADADDSDRFPPDPPDLPKLINEEREDNKP